MLKTVRVEDYMTVDPLAFRPDQEVLSAIHHLLEHRLSGAPVVDPDGKIVGFFSERDGLAAALNASYYEQPGGPVRQFMSPQVVTLKASASMADAIEMFVKSNFRCYPVVSDGKLVGQLSRRDALKALEKLW